MGDVGLEMMKVDDGDDELMRLNRSHPVGFRFTDSNHTDRD